MNELERIQTMEQALDTILGAQKALSKALMDFEAVQPQMISLFRYYGSSAFHQDCILDARGLLPKDLKRGVLSEDAVYNLFQDLQDMAHQMQTIAQKTVENIKPEE